MRARVQLWRSVNIERAVVLGRGSGRSRLWALGGEPGARPALGEGPGYGLRLRARGTGGAVAPRARPGIRSTVNCTLGGRRNGRFQRLSPSERPCWRLRPPLGVGGRPPTSTQRPTTDLAATILPRTALNGHPRPGTVQRKR